MFLVNSRLGLFSAACLYRHPFSLSYGVNLPSSLTGVLPSVLGSSPRLPVSVCSTGTLSLDRGFSRQCGFSCFATLSSLPFTPQDYRARGFAYGHSLNAWTRSTNRALSLSSCVTPSLIPASGGTGFSTGFPSPTPLGLGLGPDLP